jgi:hypothetical protein
MAVMAIFAMSAVPAFADNTTTEGTEDVISTVLVEGTINPLMVSVTHTATVAYSIDPNTGSTSDIIAPDIMLVNNTLVPINVTVQSFSSSSGGTIQFADVAVSDRDWANLNKDDSKEFIALGVEIQDTMEWNTGYNENTYYAADGVPILFGTLNNNSMGALTLVAEHGLAFDQTYTAMHNLVFMFNLV